MLLQKFTHGYLQQNNIGAMLDSTIRLNGKSIGVVCHEHAGGTRKWVLDQQNFAGSVADLSRIVMERACVAMHSLSYSNTATS